MSAAAQIQETAEPSVCMDTFCHLLYARNDNDTLCGGSLVVRRTPRPMRCPRTQL